MFCVRAGRSICAANRLAAAQNLTLKRFRYGKPYLRYHWPEPITQQTLGEFLHDINYFEEPRKFVNIGLQDVGEKKPVAAERPIDPASSTTAAIAAGTKEIEDILSVLSEDTEPPELDYDDISLSRQQLVDLATTAGVFRDLFSKYSPDREHIRITQKQAENMDKLVPYYWITDQPFARVERHPKEREPLHYFEPVIGISPRFVNTNEDEQFAHLSYHGNIIPASEAIVKPCITLDGRHDTNPKVTRECSNNNWTPGEVKLVNFDTNKNAYYTVALVNLDHLHKDRSNLHWMVANMEPAANNPTTAYEEVCEYLPVHGIRGFGYSRYVFLVFQHDSKLDLNKFKISSYSLDERAFDVKNFIDQNKAINLLPVGLSWFQTTWDNSSNQVFHNYLQMKAPVYDLIYAQPENPYHVDPKYPGKIPFNIFLDYKRDKKEINEQVLLERLKSVDPYDYKDQYVPPKVPPTVFEDKNIPTWMKVTMFKKKNKIGYWRGLRPASATLPLNNNADLDHPLRPVASAKKVPPGWHNKYYGKAKLKFIKDMPVYTKPINEHSATYIQEDHEVHLDKVREMMQGLETKDKSGKSK